MRWQKSSVGFWRKVLGLACLLCASYGLGTRQGWPSAKAKAAHGGVAQRQTHTSRAWGMKPQPALPGRTLAAADFDEDGVPDLVTGGPNFVSVAQGNADALYPYAPAAQQHRAMGVFTDAPFPKPAQVLALPVTADFLGTGDFDADGHWDIVAAARDGDALYWLAGDGRGGLAAVQRVALPGRVTALAVGEINRRDGLNDVVAGVLTPKGAQVLVFEGPAGALRAPPEVLQMPQPVTALALGQLNNGYEMDLAIAAGSQLFVVAGRDRKLSLDATQQAHVKPPQSAARAKAALAKTKDGASVLAQLNPTPDAAPVLAMRLNGDAVDDLVIWRTGQSAPEFQLSAPTATFTVNSTADTDDGLCNAANCTLREALNAANNNAGADIINFNISGPSPFTINLQSTLPETANQPLVIDGTTQPGFAGTPIIELNATGIAGAILNIHGPQSVVRGLVINRFADTGLNILNTASGTLIEGNFFGTTVSGTATFPVSAFRDLRILGAANCTIGGTTAAARNLFAGPADGTVSIEDDSNAIPATGNIVQGNYMGTNIAGTGLLGAGITHIINSHNNVIGGTVPNARNIIAPGVTFNQYTAVSIGLGSGNLIQGNYIGTDATGATLLGSPNGVVINNTSTQASTGNNLIGGTVSSARNVIAGGNFAGIWLFTATSGNLVQGNYIGTNAAGTAAFGYFEGVKVENCPNNTIGGAVVGARNLVAGSMGAGVFLTNAAKFNQVLGNYIGTNVNGDAPLPNDQGVFIENADANTIGGVTSGAGNVISGNTRDGLVIYGGPRGDNTNTNGAKDNIVAGNLIGTNANGTGRLANGNDGVQVTIVSGLAQNTIGGPTAASRNIISGNQRNGISIGIRISRNSTNGVQLTGTGGRGVTVQNNYIGTDLSGENCLGNLQDGIFVDADSNINDIRDNLIACNGRNGVFIPNVANGAPGLRINLNNNAIYQNASLGIDLGTPGVTENDPGDLDDGPNRLQNFPVLTSVAAPSPPSQTARPTAIQNVNGTLNSNPNSTFTINWYYSAATSCTNKQNGQPLALGRIPGIRTDANGNAAFFVPFEFPAGQTSGRINATATDPNGNTSEFSACLLITAPATDSTVRFDTSSFTASEGNGRATLTVTRSGNTTGAARVDYRTVDTQGFLPCSVLTGRADQRCDYAATSGTLNFAANETSKTFVVPLSDDAYAEGPETIDLALSNASDGMALGVPARATLFIADNDTATVTNPRTAQAQLSGTQEVPAVTTNATGAGTVTLNETETSISVNLSFTGLSSTQTAAHIHGPALVRDNAPVLFTLANGPVTNQTFAVTPAQVAQLKAGLLYFNVLTANHPNGELRGQILLNPLESARFFVRQQYLDFLSREPDANGYDFWTCQITRSGPLQPDFCGPTPITDLAVIRQRRVAVSNAFFFELEYQQTGTYVYRLYRAAYGHTQPYPNPNGDNDTHPYCAANPTNCTALRAAYVPAYEQFAADRASLDASQLAATQLALATRLTQRPEFAARYPLAQTAEQYVDALLANIQVASNVNLSSQRTGLLNLYNSAGGSAVGRGAVLFRLAEDNATGNPINNRALIDAEYNGSFVTTQYFGYLRRDADLPGLNFWLSVVNQYPLRSATGQNGMVCAFITAREYQERFGLGVTRSNQTDCP